MNKFPDLTLTSLDTMTCFDPVTGDFLCEIDELQNAKIANAQDQQDITGRGGRLLNSLKKNKAVTVSGSNGLVSGGLLELQTGGELQAKESTPILYREYVIIKGNKASITYKAIGSVGNEISKVYIRNTDGTPSEKLTQGTAPDEKVFTYDPETKEIAFVEDKFPDGTSALVYYTRNVKGGYLVNDSAKFSKKASVYIDATYEDRCANVYRVQFYVPLGDFSGTYDLDMGDNQMVHNFEFKSLATKSACVNGETVEDGALWTYTVFGANAEDAEDDAGKEEAGEGV